ncbi:uncharacterized protein VTP21DRAFT_7371 [Calcarisporiella thermophila]|uniref:uncharacterized protein n=1 Tax=Calcarisporiella thermophila TaxID=911321 RepID=UPI003742C170
MSTVKKLNDKVIRQLRASLTITSVKQCIIELVQNALDANATTIEILVDLSSYVVQVTDNGDGITPIDLRRIGERYVTSKLSSMEELLQIRTLGFRGEALASISDVALLEVSSKHKGSYTAYMSIVKNGNVLEYGPARAWGQPKSGTRVIVRDLFYKFPIRRKKLSSSGLSLENEINSIRRALETLALAFPSVTFTLEDQTRNTRLLKTQKSDSMLTTFCQIFGAPLAKGMKRVELERDDIRIHGFMSTRGYYTKYHQYLYINYRHVAHTSFHKLINQLFAQSLFLKQPTKSWFSENCHPNIAYESDQTKKIQERYPIFILNVICPPSEYDLCRDPTKTIIEFENIAKFLSIFQHLVAGFLLENDYLTQSQYKAMCSLDGNFSDKINVVGGQTQTPGVEPLEESKKTRALQTLCPTAFERGLFQTPPPSSQEEDYKLSVPMLGYQPSIVSTSSDEKDSHHDSNPNFDISTTSLKSFTGGAGSITTSKFFQQKEAQISNPLPIRLNKEALEQAEVIAQIDSKFIACLLPDSIVVLVDQHAADERIRVENLLEELAAPRRVRLEPSLEISMTAREASLVESYIGQFWEFGIGLEVKEKHAVERSTSRHFSQKDADLLLRGDAIVSITHLPSLIIDRCVVEPRLVYDLVRQHIHWLEEASEYLAPVGSSDKTINADNLAWVSRLHDCPRGILDLANSKACRSAIMFNDLLTPGQCRTLIAALAKCVFPFQCAHGR